jgi:hypothetical protein
MRFEHVKTFVYNKTQEAAYEQTERQDDHHAGAFPTRTEALHDPQDVSRALTKPQWLLPSKFNALTVYLFGTRAIRIEQNK